jgi:hypothetical protein
MSDVIGDLVDYQFALSTAEDELNLFTGAQKTELPPHAFAPLPAGIYRVIDGELVRIVPGLPIGS